MKRSGKRNILERLVGLFVPDLRSAWCHFRFNGQPFGNGYRMDIHITPAVIWTPWQRSTLASIPDLDITTHAGSFGVEWWTWKLVLSYGLSVQPNAAGQGREAYPAPAGSQSESGMEG